MILYAAYLKLFLLESTIDFRALNISISQEQLIASNCTSNNLQNHTMPPSPTQMLLLLLFQHYNIDEQQMHECNKQYKNEEITILSIIWLEQYIYQMEGNTSSFNLISGTEVN